MLLGGCGPQAREAVEQAARRLGLEAVHDGPLSIAAPNGSLEEGEAGGCRVWMSGRIESAALAPLYSWPAAAALAPGPVSDRQPAPEPSGADLVAFASARLGLAGQMHLHGAYLLVVSDRSRELVRVSHDHLGARSLSYVRRGRDTFFAEHIVDLLALLPSIPAPDRGALVHWIDRRRLPLGRSLFSGIARLTAGHALEISGDQVAARQFWRPAYQEPALMSRRDCAEAMRTAAFAAVARAAADLRRPAVKLSGGLDSACIAAGLAAAAGGRHALALGATFPDYPDTDEASLIEQSAAKADLELIAIPHADVAIFPPVVEYIDRWALPPGSPHAAIWRPLMAEARARRVDGLLDGEGGDELFGVAPYLIADRLRTGRLRDAWRLTARLPWGGEQLSESDRLHLLRMYGVSGATPRAAQQLRRRLRSPREGISPLVLDQDVAGLVAEDDQWAWKTGDGPLWWQSSVDAIVSSPERLDANGEMARDAVDGGIDRRHPFVHDARLAQAVLAIPPEPNFDPIRDRPLLRDGLAGAIPEAVRTRHAKSFFSDISARAFAGREGAQLIEQLAPAAAPVREYVRAEGLDQLREISTARGARLNQLTSRLFRVACVDTWLRHISGLESVSGD